MPNSNFNDDYAKNRSKGTKHKEKRAGKGQSFNERTAGWGALPGKTGRARNAGVTKVKQYPKSAGL